MGGSAFAARLDASAFPRMPPAVYNALKERLLPQISRLYEYVAVPFEAPEKTTYGDVDFIAACPLNFKDVADQVNVPHESVQSAIGARHANLMNGNRTSNFAVPVAVDEWTTLGYGSEEQEARRLTHDGDIYYQVDVNVCADKAEFERIAFYHSYGDLGMIMGLLAHNVGLNLGEKGLKLPDPPNPPIELSQSFKEILEFMGWSMDTWKAGFQTKREIFEWAGSTRFFNPGQFRSHGEGFRKVKTDRKMYAEFVQWAGEKTALAGEKRGKRTEEQLQEFRDLALVHFNKKDLFDTLAREREKRAGLKQAWSGSRVRDWAELGNYWKGVKLIMDAVRERLGGDEGVTKLYGKEGEDGIKRLVLEEKKRLSISSFVREKSADITSTEGDLARGITSLSVT